MLLTCLLQSSIEVFGRRHVYRSGGTAETSWGRCDIIKVCSIELIVALEADSQALVRLLFHTIVVTLAFQSRNIRLCG